MTEFTVTGIAGVKERKLTVPAEIKSLPLLRQVDLLLQEMVQLRQVVTEQSHALLCQQALLSLLLKKNGQFDRTPIELGWTPIKEACLVDGMPVHSTLRRWIQQKLLVLYDPNDPTKRSHYRQTGKQRRTFINVPAILEDIRSNPDFPYLKAEDVGQRDKA